MSEKESKQQLEVIQAVYDKMIEDLAKLHAGLVESNFAMRSMELAKTQIETKGDIKIDYARSVLDEHYENLSRRKKDLSTRVYLSREYVHKFRRVVYEIADYDVDEGGDKVRDVFGY